jgi:hypothetical protein
VGGFEMTAHWFLILLVYHFHRLETIQPYANHAQCVEAAAELNRGVALKDVVWECRWK